MEDEELEKKNDNAEVSVDDTQNNDANTNDEKEKKPKTYSRDEVNKIVNAEKDKMKEEILKDIANKKAEAEKLAQMDENQKKDYQLQEALKRATEAEKKLSARDLETETMKQANNKGIPLELVQTLDFEKESAESISKKLEIFEKTAKQVREKAISEFSKEDAPQTGDDVDTTELSEYEKFVKNMK